MPTPTPCGPAASHLSSLHPSNPYNFPPALAYAGRLPPKVTSKHIFFFGYEDDGHGDPHVCFQQWFPAPFKAPRGRRVGDGKSGDIVEFPTTEHYMMYQKALLMNDDEIAEQILQESHPSTAKMLGRKVKNFDLKVWTQHADEVVMEANYLKFSQNEDLKEVLLQTGNKEIVEASPDDRIWGIGFNSEDAEEHELEWGKNGLGKALMRRRYHVTYRVPDISVAQLKHVQVLPVLQWNFSNLWSIAFCHLRLESDALLSGTSEGRSTSANHRAGKLNAFWISRVQTIEEVFQTLLQRGKSPLACSCIFMDRFML